MKFGMNNIMDHCAIKTWNFVQIVTLLISVLCVSHTFNLFIRHIMNVIEKEGRNVHIIVTLRRVRVIIVAVGKKKITNSGCMSVALGILHAKAMRHVRLLSAAFSKFCERA